MMVTREGPWDQSLWQGWEEGRGRQRAKLGCPAVPTAVPGELESLGCPGHHPKWGLPARPWRPLGSARAAGCP